ncbi:MAG TPA: CpsB/CapC family capsule biosynthesis tyrosine phosphatase [Polyangiaceae bacterium]|nr:CpsB/CapC family capsule biosynthesis tyrosine phosphatase [Polyangiaceae bacterium]
MNGFVDLHCHFVPGIDDGATTAADGIAMLVALGRAGFDEVVATPHMRPGLFDNDANRIKAAYATMLAQVEATPGLPSISLSSEHYFCDLVYERIVNGEALLYPGGRAVLLEFYEVDFLPAAAQRLFDLRRRRILPVIAHPERYRSLWKSHERLKNLVETGAVALLDVAALVGKYGKEPQKCARRLLDDGLYHAACSDAHRVSDVEEVQDGIRFIQSKYGEDEVDFLLRRGPREILAGTVSS